MNTYLRLLSCVVSRDLYPYVRLPLEVDPGASVLSNNHEILNISKIFDSRICSGSITGPYVSTVLLLPDLQLDVGLEELIIVKLVLTDTEFA
jgi:hypothetical protein